MAIQQYFDRAKVDYDEVYEAGKKAEWNEFWDAIQQNGTRGDYSYAFRFFADSSFYPKYDIQPTSAIGMFGSSNIVDLKQRLLDCGVTLDFSKTTNLSYMFSPCYTIIRVPTITATSATTLEYMFSNDNQLIEIEKIVLKSDGTQSLFRTFRWCAQLEQLTIEGVIGHINGIDLQSSTKLSKASITSVVNALSTTTSGLTATFSKTAVESAFGSTTSEEWLALVATKSNWTISLV
jgi:hypothetical protein